MVAQCGESEEKVTHNINLVLGVEQVGMVSEFLESLAGRFNISLSFKEVLS